jgi:uncharacterized protein (DUF1778 family)
MTKKPKKRPSQLWYTPEIYEQVKRAAALDRRSMTNFALRATLAEAERVLREEKEKSCPPESS